MGPTYVKAETDAAQMAERRAVRRKYMADTKEVGIMGVSTRKEIFLKVGGNLECFPFLRRPHQNALG